MQSFSLAPIPQLKGFLKNIWILNGPELTKVEKMIPFGCMDLVYLEENGVIYKGDEEKIFGKNELFLTGQVTCPYHFEYKANCKMIGFGFYPHTIHFFLKETASQLTDKSYLLSDIIPSSNKLLAQVGEETHLLQKINLIQHFILNQIQSNTSGKQKQEYLRFVLLHIFAQKGCLDAQWVRQELKVSQRYIQRLFKEYVGVSPHLYGKIIQFLHSIDTYQNGSTRLTDVALDSGYYDQSHYIKDFRRFTGVSPKQYFKGENELLNEFVASESGSLLYNSVS